MANKVGWHHTEETKKILSEKSKQNPSKFWLGKKRPPPSEEVRKKISEALKGRPAPNKDKKVQFSKQHAKNHRAAIIGNKWNVGKKASEETKRKMSEAQKKRVRVPIKRRNPEERFWEKVKKTKTCWIWTGFRNDNGYGVFSCGKKRYIATRFVWFLTYGEFPKNNACHHCDNPICVRPDHLFDGTDKENMQDCMKKGRKNQVVGFISERRRFTFEIAEEIRAKHRIGISYKLLREEYGVDNRLLYNIIHNITYRK